jgi:hypothetical protein
LTPCGASLAARGLWLPRVRSCCAERRRGCDCLFSARGAFADRNETVALPAGCKQPSAGRRYGNRPINRARWRRRGARRRRAHARRVGPRKLTKAVEIRRGGTRVEALGLHACRRVLRCVDEHINDSVTDSSRRGERATVPAVRPDCPAPHQQAIQPLRETNDERAHPRAQRAPVRSFDEQMNVVGLHGELDHAEFLGMRSPQTSDGQPHLGNTNRDRKERSFDRSVTCTGLCRQCSGRDRCRTRPSPAPAFLPAPARAPPQDARSGRDNC